MQTQQMAHAQIAVPADCLALVSALVTRLGGQVKSGASFDAFLAMPEMERGGKMLKGLRQRAGLTQKEIANALGLPQSHISEFEKDKRNIPYKHAQKLALLLQSLPSHFMKPNNETLEAMRELDEGKGIRAISSQELFSDLGI